MAGENTKLYIAQIVKFKPYLTLIELESVVFNGAFCFSCCKYGSVERNFTSTLILQYDTWTHRIALFPRKLSRRKQKIPLLFHIEKRICKVYFAIAADYFRRVRTRSVRFMIEASPITAFSLFYPFLYAIELHESKIHLMEVWITWCFKV